MSVVFRMAPQEFVQTRIRFPKEVKDRLEQVAHNQRKTMNRFVVEAIIEELNRLDKLSWEKSSVHDNHKKHQK